MRMMAFRLAVRNMDRGFARFFEIKDIETRLKFYKYIFLLSLVVIGVLYWSCHTINENLRWD